MSVNSKMTSIADKIRTIRGTSGSMGLDAMATGLDVVQTDMTAAFSAVGDKGGTVPSSKVSGNLATAINSIPAGMELNFEVVGNPQPSNPKENTIWLNTDQEITGWHFSENQPENMAEGEVWFKTGNFSDVSFNALKENTIQVYPSSVIQWVSGELKEVVAKTYKNGAWVDLWNGYVVRDGIAIKDLAVLNATWSSSSGDIGNDATVTQKSGYVSVKGAHHGYCAAYVQMNITPATRLVVEGSFTTGSEIVLAVWSKIGSYVSDNMVASVLLSSTGASLDVSGLTGLMYVGITSTYTNEQKIVNLYLE